MALREWYQSEVVWIEMGTHGRMSFPELDLSRTVGWMNVFPYILLDLAGARSTAEVLEAVKTQLRLLPDQGLGCEVLRDKGGASNPEGLGPTLPKVDIFFNYVGQQDMLLQSYDIRVARERAGASVGLEMPLSYPIKVEGGMLMGQLQLNWLYSRDLHYRATIERVAQRHIDILHDMIQMRAAATPADRMVPADVGLTPARTPIEEQIAAVWCELLGHTQVGIHDNFFAIGGDSMLLLRVNAKLRQAGLMLTNQQLFAHQTIAELADLVSTADPPTAEPNPAGI
jgi:non-ribosomal peptide synthase protein (TIGR01720 family)